MQFEFSTASRIIFGPGSFGSIGNIVLGYGNEVLLIHAGPEEIHTRAITILHSHGIKTNSIRVQNEPTIAGIQALLDQTKQFSFNSIIGIGGGSCLDTAKALSALNTNPGEVTDYLEVIGSNKHLSTESTPLIAIPTTAGTGSEVTKNAVLGSNQHKIKVSLRSPYLLPKIALIDPELTVSLSPEITIYTGLDALTQLIEAYTCNVPNPITDALAIEGIKRISRSIMKVYVDGSDLQARENMSLASLFSGIVLANAKLGAVHGLAGPLGGELGAPHGAICACLLSHVMEANIVALNARDPENLTLKRYEIISKNLLSENHANLDTGYQWVRNLCANTRVPTLSEYGLDEKKFETIITKARNSSSMKGNPITLSDDELRNILYKAL